MRAGNYIYSKLSAAAGVTALVSTRIYPMLMPDKPSFPAVAYSVQNRPLDASKKDVDADHDTATVTLTIWADIQQMQDAYTSLDDIDTAIRAALDYQQSTAGGVNCEFCKYVSSEDVISEDRLLLGRVAVYQLITKNT